MLGLGFRFGLRLGLALGLGGEADGLRRVLETLVDRTQLLESGLGGVVLRLGLGSLGLELELGLGSKGFGLWS